MCVHLPYRVFCSGIIIRLSSVQIRLPLILKIIPIDTSRPVCCFFPHTPFLFFVSSLVQIWYSKFRQIGISHVSSPCFSGTRTKFNSSRLTKLQKDQKLLACVGEPVLYFLIIHKIGELQKYQKSSLKEYYISFYCTKSAPFGFSPFNRISPEVYTDIILYYNICGLIVRCCYISVLMIVYRSMLKRLFERDEKIPKSLPQRSYKSIKR